LCISLANENDHFVVFSILLQSCALQYVSSIKSGLDSKKIPFDSRETILRVPEEDNLDRDWGAGDNN